jgi:tRNA(Ile)-lysidine synthase TilS/MesJ
MKNDMRDIYEKYTKKIRYNSYKSVSENPIVILGHNKDDAFENILTNITYRNKYENLTGMDTITKIDNITFIRPLLDVSKDEIYKFAKDHNISYLKNSTPDWCQRGKIRNHVVPCLNNWDSRTINGMFNLSEVLKEYDMILKNIINDFNDNQIFNIDNINLSLLYWRSGIFKLFTKKNYIFGEDPLSYFKDHFKIEAFVENATAFEGEGILLGKFGVEVQQNITLTISRKRFAEEATKIPTLSDRPVQLTAPTVGDLFYFPLSKALFEIKFIDPHHVFFQQGQLYT